MPEAVGSPNTITIVGLSDLKLSNDPAVTLGTDALGSCVAVAIYDPEARVGGLLNFMLPDSGINRAKALLNPCLFADTGISRLLQEATSQGAVMERLRCTLIGASDVVDPSQKLNIGLRNQLAAEAVLSKNGMLLHGKHVGGTSGMTVALSVRDGRVTVTLPNGEQSQL